MPIAIPLTTVTPQAASRPATPADLKITAKAAHLGIEVVMDGRVMGENLSRLSLDEAWLTTQLHAQGYRSVKEILLAVYRPEEKKLTVYQNED
jgi:uncharacterized membrane protein YcaP (DUF421 family)